MSVVDWSAVATLSSRLNLCNACCFRIWWNAAEDAVILCFGGGDNVTGACFLYDSDNNSTTMLSITNKQIKHQIRACLNCGSRRLSISLTYTGISMCLAKIAFFLSLVRTYLEVPNDTPRTPPRHTKHIDDTMIPPHSTSISTWVVRARDNAGTRRHPREWPVLRESAQKAHCTHARCSKMNLLG